MSESLELKKPSLRGYLHQESFFVSLGACLLLLINSSRGMSLAANAIYSLSILLLFGISALYHRIHWEPKARALMKRLDHSAIFLLIAGTFTPICLFALSEQRGQNLLLVVWLVAFIGILQSIFWVKAPKWLTAIFYVAMGWLAAPYLGELRSSLGELNLFLLAFGGAVYTIGAVFYALKKPNLIPNIFGYHELFHLFTIVGAGFHFAVIYNLSN